MFNYISRNTTADIASNFLHKCRYLFVKSNEKIKYKGLRTTFLTYISI